MPVRRRSSVVHVCVLRVVCIVYSASPCKRLNENRLSFFRASEWDAMNEQNEMSTFSLFPLSAQLPVRVGIHGPQARLNYEHTMTCLIQISRYKFSLILAGLTRALQRTSESVSFIHCAWLGAIAFHFMVFVVLLYAPRSG